MRFSPFFYVERVFLGRDDGENGMTKPENGTDRFFLQTSCASSGRNDEEERTDFKGFILKKIYIPRATHDY